MSATSLSLTYDTRVNSDERNQHDLPVLQIMTPAVIGVYIEMGITRWTLGPRDGSGPTVLEAGIPKFLHIRELSTPVVYSCLGEVALLEDLSAGSAILICMMWRLVWLDLCACLSQELDN